MYYRFKLLLSLRDYYDKGFISAERGGSMDAYLERQGALEVIDSELRAYSQHLLYRLEIAVPPAGGDPYLDVAAPEPEVGPHERFLQQPGDP